MDITQFTFLLQRKVISWQELKAARIEALRHSQDIATILISTYGIAKHEVGKALSQYYGCPFLAFGDYPALDAALVQRLTVDDRHANSWVPLGCDGDIVDILLCDPKDAALRAHIQQQIPGFRLRLFVGLHEDILDYRANSTRYNDLTVEHCTWKFKCDQRWHVLEYTADASVRYCQICAQNVYLARSRFDLWEHVASGHCVAFYAGDAIDTGRLLDLDYEKRVGDSQRRP